MQFASLNFIFCFLPLFLVVYYVFPQKYRTIPMLVGSFLFYALSCSGNYWWCAVLAVAILLTWLAGLSLRKGGREFLLVIYLTILAATLVFFKVYSGGKYLPSGMSFYLFQLAAYLIAVYRQQIQADENILHFGAQISMFPKLLSGPIVPPQLMGKGAEGETMRDGLKLFILGLGLKVLLANRLGGLWSQADVIGYEYISTPGAWLTLIAYAMQLYFDFYGYSLMAIGLGRMLGFELPKNFDHPYASRSVSEFYRRWHMTLGTWFRENLYILLGGNRKGTVRTIMNLAVVWLFTGLWHGVGGNYLIWAGFLLFLIIHERLWLNRFLKRSHVLSRVYLMFVILISWVPFAIGSLDQMMVFLGRLFGAAGQVLNPLDYQVFAQDYWFLLGIGILFVTPVPEKLWKRIRSSVFSDILLAALFWVIVYYISTSAQDPFLYFQY